MGKTTEEILAELRSHRLENRKVEVKEAVGGLPKSLVDTVSAFSNDEGGVILLGITGPAQGAEPAAGFSPEPLHSALETLLREKITPPVAAAIAIETLTTGERIIRIDVPEGNPHDKPYYVTARGMYLGSYTRLGEGDQKLTHYEIDRLLENKKQPNHDAGLVLQAGAEDLDPALVRGYIDNLRERQPRVFGALDDEAALLRSRVLAKNLETGQVHPTLAGLLALGSYPQGLYPQLDMSIVVLPTTMMGETAEDGTRFLDNHSCVGAIPSMLEDAAGVLIRNMRNRASIATDGIGRSNRYDYPLDVIRELLANALLHRDYSPESRSAKTQVELYPDRLVVRNPGACTGR